jgi:hypothetical protein
MKLSPEAKVFVESTRLFSGASFDQIKNFYESMFSCIMSNYMEGRVSDVPFLGKLEISYDHDEVTSDGREAVLNIKLVPDKVLKRSVGQLVDGVPPEEVFKIYSQRIKQDLDSKLL